MTATNGQASLELSQFRMDSIRFESGISSTGPVIVIIGRRGAGKSVLINDILFHHQHIPSGVVVSGTEICNHNFGKIIPKSFIHNEYSSGIVENILRRQYFMAKHRDQEMLAYNTTNVDSRIFFILDDCLYDDGWCRDKMMRMLFMNGRHWQIMLIISMQAPLGIPPALRTNVDYVFIMRASNLKDKKKIYDNYCACFPTFEVFLQVLDSCTNNFEMLVVNNTVQSNRLQDIVSWYKAALHPPFRLFSEEIWQTCNFESTDTLPSFCGAGQYDPTRFKKKGNTTNMLVKKLK